MKPHGTECSPWTDSSGGVKYNSAISGFTRNTNRNPSIKLTITIEFGKKSHFNSLKDLYDKHWRPNYVAMRPDFFEWQYRQNPYLPTHLEEGSVMAIDDGEVIGFLGLIPVQFRVGSTVVNGVYPSNWITHPRVRGRGIGHYLMAKVLNEWPIIAGTSLTRDAWTTYLRLGFRYVNKLSRWIIVLDPDETAKLLPENDDTKNVLRRRSISLNGTNDLYFVHDNPFVETADDLWERLAEELPIASVRTAKYLNWRYHNHPDFKYNAIVVGRPDCWEGLAVVRKEQVKNSDINVLRIVEFMALPNVQEVLGLSVINYAKDTSCAFVDAFGLSERPVRGLLKTGAFNEDEEPDLLLPHLLQPIDHRRSGVNFVARSQVPFKGFEVHYNLTDWYISKGDCDQDRPN
mgnify:CR=1 FL=1